MIKIRAASIITHVVAVHPHEISTLIHSFACFFFILCSYFIVIPLRDEGAISLGLNNLPGLFIGSLTLTLVAAPVTTVIFSLEKFSKRKALVLIHRFFSASFVLIFILWCASTGYSPFSTKDPLYVASKNHHIESSVLQMGRSYHGLFYVSVRISVFLWVALFNLISISSTWARIIDVMGSESGPRLFGIVGAGATLGQLCGSVLAVCVASIGPYLFLVAAFLMELAAQSSKGIVQNITHVSEELYSIRETDECEHADVGQSTGFGCAPKSSNLGPKSKLFIMLEGLLQIISSTYLLHVSLFLWLGAVISSFFYFQKVNVIAMTIASSTGRRRLLAEINSFIAVFILAGQLTLTGRILTYAGITVALCSAPFIAFTNMLAVAVWPSWVVVAVCEIMRSHICCVTARKRTPFYGCFT